MYAQTYIQELQKTTKNFYRRTKEIRMSATTKNKTVKCYLYNAAHKIPIGVLCALLCYLQPVYKVSFIAHTNNPIHDRK